MVKMTKHISNSTDSTSGAFMGFDTSESEESETSDVELGTRQQEDVSVIFLIDTSTFTFVLNVCWDLVSDFYLNYCFILLSIISYYLSSLFTIDDSIPYFVLLWSNPFDPNSFVYLIIDQV